MRKLLVALLLLAVLAGLVLFTDLGRPVVKWQVERTLVSSGMSETRADCMAGRMVDRLSIGQLWDLRQAMQPREGEPEEADTFGEVVKRLRRTDDFETVSVVGTSAALCAAGIG